MLKLKKPLSERLPPLILYMEDVEAIYEILARLNPTVMISTADYAFDNLGELREAGLDRTNYLSIYISNPDISLKLEPFFAALQSDDNTAASREAVESIKSVLLSRTQYLARFLQSGPIAGAFAAFSFWQLIPGFSKADVGKIMIGLIMLVVGLIWSWWAIARSHSVYPTVYLSDRKAPRHFFARRQNEIILAAVSAVVGAIITMLMFWIL